MEHCREQLKQEDEAKRLKKGSGQQAPTMWDVAMYPQQNTTYLEVTKKLAIFVGANDIPNSIVENSDLISLFKALNPSYPVPGSFTHSL